MGNTASNGNSSGLSIQLNPPTQSSAQGGYVAGSKLSGTIYAQTQEDSVGEVGLELFITGKEDVKVQYQQTVSNGDTTTTVTRYSYSKSDIVRLAVPIIGAGASISAGQYACPFEVDLPAHLPSSMYIASGGGYARIVYKVKVEVKGKWRNPKLEQEIAIVAKPPSSDPVPHSVEPTTTSVRLCCCIPRGDITFGAHVDDTRVGEGEEINVKFACKNESSAEIEYAQAEVKQHIKWHSGGHSEHSKHTIAQRNFQLDHGMAKRSKEELAQIKDLNSNNAVGIARGEKYDLYKEILETVNEGTNQVSLLIPHVAVNSYSGSLITVSHKLDVFIKTPCCSSNPKSKINLLVVSPDSVAADGGNDVMEPSAPSLPSGWDPAAVNTSDVVSGSSGNAVYGGDVATGENEDDIAVSPFNLPEDLGGPTVVSLPVLIKELNMALSVRSTIEEKLQDSNWKPLFSDLQPADFVAVVMAAKMEFDQTDLALLVAPAIANFTCEYVVAILRSVSEWLRIQFVQKLIPLCSDLNTNSSLILNEMSDWEKVSTERDFANALQA